MKAEAALNGLGGSLTADQYYYAGINANFAHWNLSNAQATAYEAQNGIKWNTAGQGFNYDSGREYPVRELARPLVLPGKCRDIDKPDRICQRSEITGQPG